MTVSSSRAAVQEALHGPMMTPAGVSELVRPRGPRVLPGAGNAPSRIRAFLTLEGPMTLLKTNPTD